MTQKKKEEAPKVNSPEEFVFKPTKRTPEEFARGYKELCSFMGYQVVVTPSWKARDDNTWSTVLSTSVGRLANK